MGIASTGTGAYREADELLSAKTQKYSIVLPTAYLLGVQMNLLHYIDEAEREKTIAELQANKPARILRNLCIARSCIMRDIAKIAAANGGLYNISGKLTDALAVLSQEGIQISNRTKKGIVDTLIVLNRNISDRVNNVRDLYPDWINWDYVRQLFVMTDGTKKETVSAKVAEYRENLTVYPFGMYINWTPEIVGNILLNDRRLCDFLYKINGARFSDDSKVTSVPDTVVANIAGFVEDAEAICVLVDCENSDPYKLCTAFRNMNAQTRNKIKRIILCDDRNTASGWDMFAEYVGIPCERKIIDRIKNNKSLVDMTLCATACKQFYQEGTDSFILVSSDSDYWALINSLKEAQYLVMVERWKVGPDLKEALAQNKIFYCYLDDFYSGGNGNVMMKAAIQHEVNERLKSVVLGNLKEILDESIKVARALPCDEERACLYQSISKSMQVTVNENGEISISITKK